MSAAGPGKRSVAVQLHFQLFTTIKATRSCPVARVEQNSRRRTSCNMQRSSHHSRDQQEHWQVPPLPWKQTDLSNQSFWAPGDTDGWKQRNNSIRGGIAQTAGKNASCWCKDTDRNWFTTDATEAEPPTNANCWGAHTLLSYSAIIADGQMCDHRAGEQVQTDLYL